MFGVRKSNRAGQTEETKKVESKTMKSQPPSANPELWPVVVYTIIGNTHTHTNERQWHMCVCQWWFSSITSGLTDREDRLFMVFYCTCIKKQTCLHTVSDSAEYNTVMIYYKSGQHQFKHTYYCLSELVQSTQTFQLQKMRPIPAPFDEKWTRWGYY